MLISTFIFVLLDSWPWCSPFIHCVKQAFLGWGGHFCFHWIVKHCRFDRKVWSWERLTPKACRFDWNLGCCISLLWHMVTCSTSELNWYLKAFLAPFAVPPSIQLSSGASVFTARAVCLSYLEQMHWPTSYRAKIREKTAWNGAFKEVWNLSFCLWKITSTDFDLIISNFS